MQQPGTRLWSRCPLWLKVINITGGYNLIRERTFSCKKMHLNHPVFLRMLNLGCTRQTDVFLAFQTFLELCEVQKAQDVDYYYSPELDLIYIVALLNSEEQVYIPMSANTSIGLDRIKNFQDVLSKHCEGKVMYIAIIDTDTSFVTYKLSKGLEKPLSPDASKERKDNKDKKNFVEIEISNMLLTLIQKAKKNNV